MLNQAMIERATALTNQAARELGFAGDGPDYARLRTELFKFILHSLINNPTNPEGETNAETPNR